MKIGLKAALGAVLVSLLLQPGLMLAQKGKPVPQPTETQLAALFRDNWDPNTRTYGDKIHSDGGGLYSTVLSPDGTYASVVKLRTDGTLFMQVLKHRKVTFEFNSPVRPAPINAQGQLTCRDWSDAVFYAAPPSFLTGVPDNDSFYFSTLHEMTYNGTEWVYEIPSPYFSPYFDFRTMPVDATASALVRGTFGFYTTADSGMFYVHPNRSAAGAAREGRSAVKVTHPYADVWIVEPQSAPQLPGEPPLLDLGPNQAGFRMNVPAVKRVQTGGVCDLGDWVMPFQITLYRQ